MKTVAISMYTIDIMGPGFDNYATSQDFDAKNQEVIDNISKHSTLVEEGFNDLLPEGFYAKIRQ